MNGLDEDHRYHHHHPNLLRVRTKLRTSIRARSLALPSWWSSVMPCSRRSEDGWEGTWEETREHVVSEGREWAHTSSESSGGLQGLAHMEGGVEWQGGTRWVVG